MVSFVLIVLISLVFSGIVIRTKSIASGRKGPGIWQPMKDIFKLFKKGAVYSETTSIIFQIAPSIYFASVLMAIMVIPLGNSKGLISFAGDFVFFAYVLAVGKFFNIISALDTGSSFEGMGASREALFSMLAEPAFFILMGSLGLLTGYTSFHEIFMAFHFGSYVSYALGVIATFILIMICMIENSRMPVDDPKTHLELTMIHEVMILDNSGFDLGLIMHTINLKFAMYGALIANMFLGDAPMYLTIPLFLSIQVLFAVVVGILESFSARFRMNHNAQFILVLSSLSLLMFFGVLMVLGKFN
ncbi:MAG: NADH-quinone oxidoreductase subunit H [Salinivirgaceae bacterium]|nr:NADH-quinone oxidoreductase subunit H [Salinivirgaceae bacterium]